MAERPTSLIRREASLFFAFATALAFGTVGKDWVGDLSSLPWLFLVLAWLLSVIVVSVFSVVRHAEALAIRLGEPFGTLILTLSVVSIEVMVISAVMLAGHENPTLARDTVYGGVMIALNGIVGAALLLGGWRHREQEYNLSGASAFLSVIVSLAVLGLILPSYTLTTEDPTFSRAQEAFMVVVCLGLYSVLLAVQTVRHRHYFVGPGSRAVEGEGQTDGLTHPVAVHFFFLLLHLAPVVLLSEEMGIPLNHTIEILGAPTAVGGFIVATVILLPEAVSSLRASFMNDVQRSINITLGSVAATIGLTIPAVLGVGILHGHGVVLGLEAVDQLLLALTLVVCLITFGSGRTNILQGAVHLVIFFAYFVLLWDGV